MPDPIKNPSGKPVKGKPLGIPMWGWLIAAALGIVIGYTILRQSKTSSTDSTSGIANADGSAIPADSEQKGSGAGMPPLEDILKAMGLRGSTSVVAQDSPPSNGASFASAPMEASVAPETLPIEPQFAYGGLENPRPSNPLYVDPYGDTTRFPSVELAAMSEALNKKYSLGQYAAPERTSQSATSMPGSTAVSTSTPVSPGGAGTRMNIPE